MIHPIKVYCPNLTNRSERRRHIECEFKNRSEFALTIIPAIEDRENGANGLYQTFIHILNTEMKNPDPNGFFIFAEDDHKFLPSYSTEYLFHSIDVANQLEAHLLVGGPTFFHIPIQCTPDLFWVRVFNGTQFTIVFHRIFKLYQAIVEDKRKILDVSLSEICNKTFTMYPPISAQKDFGYSDATPELYETSGEYLMKLSKTATQRLSILNQIRKSFNRV